MSIATTPARRAPALGGFSTTFLRLELRRMLRNRRTVIFTLIMPAVFFLIFGTSAKYRGESAGAGNVTAYVLISMAVYGAMLATTSGGAMVSIERAAGWSRQLRITPLRPVAYIATKVVVALVLGLAAVAIVCVVGAFFGARMPTGVWVGSAVLAFVCASVFAAFGLFMGYLLHSDNVMQILGPVLALLAFLGGLWIPVDQLGSLFARVAEFTPAYGVGALARYPLVQSGSLGLEILNVVVWTLIFVAGAAWRFRRDTARV
ncbi:MAG TPA: ABC transporter permease [Nocardioidaceae bacterium]|nr:ABC transporter permease [Nocardioidaceae bacterium]